MIGKIIIILLVISAIAWGINITQKQWAFEDTCKSICSEEEKEYKTTFNSLPWNRVNGKCYCTTREQRFPEGGRT